MRHFADDLRRRGVVVDLIRADSFADGVARHREHRHPEQIRLLAPSSAAGRRSLARLPGVEIVPGSLFLTDPDDFARWADGRKRIVMEHFYREQRRRLDLLMDGDEPPGGTLELRCREPRRRLRRTCAPSLPLPAPRVRRTTTRSGASSTRLGLDTWGDDGPRRWPADRAQARARAGGGSCATRCRRSGPIRTRWSPEQRTMWHSLLSSSLNLGLISPLECAEAAQPTPTARGNGADRVGGGIHPAADRLARVRLVPVLVPPGSEWGLMNALHADGPLPRVLETGETEMACLADAVGGLRTHRLRPPHRATDAVRQPAAAVRNRAGGGPGLVPPRVHRRLRLGDGAQRARDGDLGRRRAR